MLIRHSIHGFVFIDPNPLDRMPRGQTPDHHVFPFVLSCLNPCMGETVGMGDGEGMVCTVLIEAVPVGGLNCEHDQLRLNDLIIEARPLPRAT